MDLTIHTYGHIDAMYYTLNALAMLINSGFGKALVTTITMVCMGHYALKIAYAAGGDYKTHLIKVMAMIAMITLLLEPTTEMIIHDHVSKKKEKVDNLPLGFALPVGMLESFGDLLTGGFEQAFTTVDNINYRDYGMVFGARLIQESRNWRIRSPEFMENMNNFIDRCVMIDSMIGYHYTVQDLLETNDIWGLVSQNAGTLRQVAMRVGKEKTLMSCKDAAKNVLEPAFRPEFEALEKKYAKTDLGEAGNSNYSPRTFARLNSNLKKNIELSFKSYLGSAESAEQLIKQQMMVNALTSANNIDEYGVARANATQESNWRIAGEIAGTNLPMLMTIFKCLVYASFMFLVPLLIISGGWSKYLGWITLVASFQLWAPLNAVLTMFIDLYSSNSLSGIANHLVSFSSLSRVGNYSDKIVAVAAGLQIAIPYLAFTLIQGGVGGFIHLAGTITGASQSAASTAANESVTGNKSFDNYSVGNQQLYNQSGFKTDLNQSYASGGSSYQHMDGTMERVTAAGNILMQSGVGLTASSGATSYRLDDSRIGQVSEGVQTSESIHQQDLRSLSNAKSNVMNKTSDYVAHLAQREHAGESFNYDSMGERGKALQQAVNHTKMLREQHNYGWDQAARTGVEASATYGTPLKGIIGSGVSGSIKGSVDATNSSGQSIGQDVNINRENHANASYNNIVKAASNSSWAKDNSVDNSYSDATRNSYEEAQRLEQQASISQQRVNDWHRAQSVITSQGASSSKDSYQEVVDTIKKDYGVDANTAQKWADSRSPEAQMAWSKLQNDDHYVQDLVRNNHQQKSAISGAGASEQLNQFTNYHQEKITTNPDTTIKNLAEGKGMKVAGFKEGLQERGGNLVKQHQDITSYNSDQYKTVRGGNELLEKATEEQVKKYETDRIGKGFTGTLGHLVNGVGKVDNKN